MKGPKETRKELGLTLKQLQSAKGIAPNFLSQIENGKQVAYESSRDLLEDVYGQKVNWLKAPITIRPIEGRSWYDCERSFRSLLNWLAGMSEDERIHFIESAIDHLNDLKKQ